MASKLTPAQRVALARHPERPGTADFIKHLFTDFFEQRGDRLCRPVIPFIDPPGAYPGLEAEARGQAEAIARTLALSSRLTVPVVSVVTGEGGSGGALALGVGNRVLMLENAVYSVLSPEGFASILWKDASRSDEACGVMKLTAADLLELEVADRIIPEPEGGAHTNPAALFRTLDTALVKELNALGKLSGPALAAGRYKKFRAMGAKALRKEREPHLPLSGSGPAGTGAGRPRPRRNRHLPGGHSHPGFSFPRRRLPAPKGAGLSGGYHML